MHRNTLLLGKKWLLALFSRQDQGCILQHNLLLTTKLINVNKKQTNQYFICMPVKYCNGHQSSLNNMVISTFCSINIIPWDWKYVRLCRKFFCYICKCSRENDAQNLVTCIHLLHDGEGNRKIYSPKISVLNSSEN